MLLALAAWRKASCDAQMGRGRMGSEFVKTTRYEDDEQFL